MADDPRIEPVGQWLFGSSFTSDEDDIATVTGALAEFDALDPLRLALREPSDELIKRLTVAGIEAKGSGEPLSMVFVRGVLAALSEEFPNG